MQHTDGFPGRRLSIPFSCFPASLFSVRDATNVRCGFTLSEAARHVAAGPFEDVFNVTAARADRGKLFDIEHVVPVFVRLIEPFVRCSSREFAPRHLGECFGEFSGIEYAVSVLVGLTE